MNNGKKAFHLNCVFLLPNSFLIPISVKKNQGQGELSILLKIPHQINEDTHKPGLPFIGQWETEFVFHFPLRTSSFPLRTGVLANRTLILRLFYSSQSIRQHIPFCKSWLLMNSVTVPLRSQFIISHLPWLEHVSWNLLGLWVCRPVSQFPSVLVSFSAP